ARRSRRASPASCSSTSTRPSAASPRPTRSWLIILIWRTRFCRRLTTSWRASTSWRVTNPRRQSGQTETAAERASAAVSFRERWGLRRDRLLGLHAAALLRAADVDDGMAAEVENLAHVHTGELVVA